MLRTMLVECTNTENIPTVVEDLNGTCGETQKHESSDRLSVAIIQFLALRARIQLGVGGNMDRLCEVRFT
ncbi:hypothetical protein L596_013660 [Steinernema carpocapsae]|uniref:Uncharacterized protein n=1 Tax=Steinernema carpocapsae TaxID=34508 RepID=A0A4U5P1A9_STECR|nr:hypothetical protein L596_013660 [Steinernema carpocapsae]